MFLYRKLRSLYKKTLRERCTSCKKEGCRAAAHRRIKLLSSRRAGEWKTQAGLYTLSKRKICVAAIIAGAAVMCISAGIKTLDDGSVKTGELTTRQKQLLKQIKAVYQIDNQEQTAAELEEKRRKKHGLTKTC